MKKIVFILALVAMVNPCLAASDSSTGSGVGKFKSDAPIEITSDVLEVLQQEQKAIFTGHVVAVQENVHLKSEKMTVFYKSSDGKAGEKNTNKAKDDSKNASPEKNSIKKIIVEQNVFLSTPEETASGDKGNYDVENNKIYLNDNVVLTRGKNIIKGDHLVYDFATGQSTLNAKTVADKQDGASDIGNASGKKKRVKALFVPDKGN